MSPQEVESLSSSTVLPDTGFGVLSMDPDYFGSCPCFRVTLPEGTYEGHCWRVDPEHEGCGLHYEGDRDLAERMVGLLTAMDWYGPWVLVEGLRR